MTRIKISLLLPCWNEIDFIEAVLRNALEQKISSEEMEILVIDGGSDDGTREVVQRYAATHPQIQLLDNPDRYVPQAMNRGIHAARGEVIIRWDAHAAYPTDYVSRLVDYLEREGVDNVGGRWEIAPRNPGARARAIALVLAHPLGVGNATYRLAKEGAREVDTVPFGCYPRRVFERFGQYDERLRRNQDIELNRRILRGGGRIVLLPEVVITYYARSTYGGLWRNNFANGEWVIRTAAYTGTLDALSLRHFAPLVFILGMLGMLVLLLLALTVGLPTWLVLLALLPSAYFALTFGAAVWTSWQKGQLDTLFPLTWSFWVLHFSYGCGSLVGLAKVWRQRSDEKTEKNTHKSTESG
ncbi:MAG: glycosyltransferase family 2 protein [Bacteroidota bacterium]